MKKLSFWLFLQVFTIGLLASEPDADIFFMVIDLKYSEAKGVKICEVQPGCLSDFKGSRFVTGGQGEIPENFCAFLSGYPWQIWTSKNRFSDLGIFAILSTLNQCTVKGSTQAVKEDPLFIRLAKARPKDPSKLDNYSVVMIDSPFNTKNRKAFKANHPGVLLLDASSYPYWKDKQKLSLLFDTHPLLKELRPLWGYFPKKYSSHLVRQIHQKINSDILVIKPRGAFKGNGVIILTKEDLDKTLKYILGDKKKLQKDTDPSYNYWTKDSFDTFIVEEFVPSDPIFVPHLSDKPYQATMRVVCLSIFEEGAYRLQFLGSYWSTPALSLADEGTLTQKSKCRCLLPFYEKIDPALKEKVYDILRPVIPFYHKAMIEEAVFSTTASIGI